MDVKPISVAAIKPSVDSGGRERSPQQFGGGKHKLDARADSSSDDVAGEQPAQDGQVPDGIAEDALLIDAPDLAPELPTAPRPGRYINKVV